MREAGASLVEQRALNENQRRLATQEAAALTGGGMTRASSELLTRARWQLMNAQRYQTHRFAELKCMSCKAAKTQRI